MSFQRSLLSDRSEHPDITSIDLEEVCDDLGDDFDDDFDEDFEQETKDEYEPIVAYESDWPPHDRAAADMSKKAAN
jgi:hypothetical protein